MIVKPDGPSGANGEPALQLVAKDIESDVENAQTSIQLALESHTIEKNANFGIAMVDTAVTLTTLISTPANVRGQTPQSPTARAVTVQCDSQALAFRSSSTNTILTFASGWRQLH